ncbi:MAG: hypothetical protein MOGMAGMI_01757 [Candidatus Omnitrophica bacterium]|nr:hypothetical protein [Candidatus Omnitrophota bacterium]
MRSVLSVTAAVLLWASPVLASSLNPVYEELSRRPEVGIHVSDIKDESGKADVAALKAAIQKALGERKSIKFKVVGYTDADVRVDVVIKDYLYSDHDPVDMLVGAGAIAIDAAKKEHFARIIAEVTVLDAPTERQLWHDRVMATITKEPMTEAEARDLVTSDWAKTFIRNAFGKKLRK